MPYPLSIHGQLTLVPMPGFETLAELVKTKVEEIGERKPEEGGEKETKRTEVDIALPEFGKRSNDEPFLRLGKDHIGGHDVVVLTSGPGTPEMLIRLLLLLAYLKGRRASRICVVCGYMPLGRSDKDEGHQELALPPIVISLMECAAGGLLDRFISVDLHASQIVMSGWSGEITEVSLVRRIVKRTVTDAREISERLCLVFPDDGSYKRAERPVAKLQAELGFDLPVVCGTKRRVSSHESKAGAFYGDLDSLQGAIAITVDDEIATGGTNIKAAALLKGTFGAVQVWAAVTHGVLCGVAPAALSAADCPLDRVYVTDTIPLANRPELAPLLANHRLIGIPWSEDLGWIVYNHHWDKTIREVR